MNFEVLKKIGEVEKNKYAKLIVSITRRNNDDGSTIDFVQVQEAVFNEEKNRHEYSKKGYTINIERWDGFYKLMNTVDEYLHAPIPIGPQTTEPSEPKKPGFMGG